MVNQNKHLLNNLNKICRIFKLLILFLPFLTIIKASSININFVYNDTISLNDNLNFTLNVSINDSLFNRSLKIYTVDKENNKKTVFEGNFTNNLIANGKILVDKYYKQIVIDIFNQSGNLILEKSYPLYVYNLDYEYIDLNKKIIKKGNEIKIKVKLEYEDELNKELKIYLGSDKKYSKDFKENVDEEINLDCDRLYKNVRIEVYLKNNSKKIFEKVIPILVYDLDTISFSLDKETLECKPVNFELSDTSNKVEIKIKVGNVVINKTFINKRYIHDFEVNILENLNNEEKIDYIKKILEQLSKGEIKLNYEIRLYLYNDSSFNNLIEEEKIKEENYYIKSFESGEIQNNDDYDIDLNVLNYNDSVTSYSTLEVKVETQFNSYGVNEEEIKTCALFDGKLKCKTNYFNEDNDEKIYDFSFEIGDLKEGDYHLIVYAYDTENKDNIIWKIKKVEIDNSNTVLLTNVLTNYVRGKKGEIKKVLLDLENLDDEEVSFFLRLNYNGEIISKKITLKGKEEKMVEIPVLLKKDGYITIEKPYNINFKFLSQIRDIPVTVIKEESEIKNKTNKESKIKLDKNEKSEIKCSVNKDFVYIKNDEKDFIDIEGEKNISVKIQSKYGNVLINPSTFKFENEENKVITVEALQEESANDIIKIICEKNNKRKVIEIPVIIEKENFENYLLYGAIGLGIFTVLILFIIYLII